MTDGDHPRIRGEHVEHEELHQRLHGIIPAYAGSTSAVSPVSPVPRGSSPHTRGALSSALRGMRQAGDHPRIRGEHDHRRRSPLVLLGIIPAYAGSTRRLLLAVDVVEWIIPAYAGSTLALAACSAVLAGSSPHTRGARPVPPRMGFQVWIIPAYAGSTPLSW